MHAKYCDGLPTVFNIILYLGFSTFCSVHWLTTDLVYHVLAFIYRKLGMQIQGFELDNTKICVKPQNKDVKVMLKYAIKG